MSTTAGHTCETLWPASSCGGQPAGLPGPGIWEAPWRCLSCVLEHVWAQAPHSILNAWVCG